MNMLRSTYVIDTSVTQYSSDYQGFISVSVRARYVLNELCTVEGGTDTPSRATKQQVNVSILAKELPCPKLYPVNGFANYIRHDVSLGVA